MIKEKADIGFAFDGDGDRLIIVDEKGNEIDGDKIIALFAKYLVKVKNKNSKYPVISTVMSNLGLEKFLLSNLKIKLKRSSVGDINVIKEMQKNNSILDVKNALQEEIGNFGEKNIGIRPGEKLHETLINKEEIRYSWEYENLYIITPPHYSTFHPNSINESYKNIKKLEGMNEYSSDVVPKIPINELKNIFKNLI